MDTAGAESLIEHAEILRRHGLHVTAQRCAVLDAVAAQPHCAVDDITQAVRARLGSVSRQAVYDVLAALTAAGLLRRIQPALSPARYERRVGDNHHHLVCRDCGRMVDVDCSVGAAPCLFASQDAGFEIDEAEVIYWGRCPECASSHEASIDPPFSAHRDTNSSNTGPTRR